MAVSPEVRTALVSVITAVVAAVSTLGVGYYAGLFQVQNTETQNRGTIELEKLKFSNELIKTALAAGNSANSLKFYADIGLLSGLDSQKVKEYATAELERIKSGGAGESVLPNFGGSGLWIDRTLLSALAPDARAEVVDALISTGNYILGGFGIAKSEKRLATFLSIAAYSTAGFKSEEENANYSSDRLTNIFPTYFDARNASGYANNPEKILNRIYANRMGNGPEETGDGWKYRGRGLMLITGRANYERLAKQTGIDLVERPDMLGDPHVSILVAATYWVNSGLNELADSGTLEDVTKKIDGGGGLAEKRKYYDRVVQLLKK